MSKPSIKETIAGYDFEWPDQHLKISVTRLKSHRDGRINGWVMMTTNAEGYAPLLHQCDFNFTSSQIQKQLVNTMAEKYKTASWDEVIEQLRYYILERMRQGEPVMRLSTMDEDAQPPTYLIHPWLPEDQPTILFGEPGVGKSRLSLIAYITLLLPWHDNPLGLTAPETSISPLICDWEADDRTIKWRAKCIQEGMNLAPFEVHYRRCNTRFADDIEQIQIAIEEVGAKCLIIDSLAAASGGDVMKPEMASDFFTALRKLKITSLIIAQTQKNPELKKRSVLGTTIFEYYARSIWEARKSQTVGEDELHIALHHRKANDSKLFMTTAYRFSFNESKTVISRESIKDVPDFVEDMPTKIRVLIALQDLGRATPEIISEAAGISEGNTKATLSRLKKDGKVMNFRDNTWGAITSEYE